MDRCRLLPRISNLHPIIAKPLEVASLESAWMPLPLKVAQAFCLLYCRHSVGSVSEVRAAGKLERAKSASPGRSETCDTQTESLRYLTQLGLKLKAVELGGISGWESQEVLAAGVGWQICDRLPALRVRQVGVALEDPGSAVGGPTQGEGTIPTRTDIEYWAARIGGESTNLGCASSAVPRQAYLGSAGGQQLPVEGIVN